MPAKTRGQEGYGKGETVEVDLDGIRDAYAIVGGPKKRDPLNHPLFAGVGRGTLERFRRELQNTTLTDGRRLTRHSAEEGRSSPRNDLYLAGADPLNVRLHTLALDPDKKLGPSLGDATQLDISNLRSWFGDATNVPTQPGLTVTAVGNQRAHRLPSLTKFYDPYRPDEGILREDVERLLINTAGIFSALQSEDNRAEAAQADGFTAHELALLSEKAFDALTHLSGVRHKQLTVNRNFSPDELGLKGPHALVLSGQGMFFDRTKISGGYTHPLARLGNVEAGTSAQAFAFQWAALDPKNIAKAVFVPTARTSVLTIPTTGNLDLLHAAVDSIAASAASMREHVVAEAQRMQSEKPIGQRLTGMLKRWGLLS